MPGISRTWFLSHRASAAQPVTSCKPGWVQISTLHALLPTLHALLLCRMHPNPALSVLYVLTECIHTEGYLTAYKVDPSTGGMKELGRVTLTGRSSCYISFDKYAHHAVVTNYWDGLINVVELSPAGVPLCVVQEHQQTRREAWRQVENREVSYVLA